MPNVYGNVYGLHWSKTTPFSALGRKGAWTLRWRLERRAYVLTLDGGEVGTFPTVVKGKEHAERIEGDCAKCSACGGTGWVGAQGTT